MKILNSNLEKDLLDGRSISLDLGSGRRPRKGFYALDHLEMSGIDVVANLNEPLALLPDNCCQQIYSNHTLEHVHELLPLMREIYRIVKPGGTIEINVPHFSNVYGFSDPTHVRFFGLYSMYYFVSPENQPKSRKVPAFYTDVRFKVKSLNIAFLRRGFLDRYTEPLLTKLVNQNIATQDFYERRLSSLFHAQKIQYLLEPDK